MNPSNSNSKQLQLILQGHSRPIKDIKFSDNRENIYTASNDRNVIMWNSNTGEKVKEFAHSAAVNNIQLTKDRLYMVTGDNTGCVYLWDTRGGVLLKQIEQNPTLCVRSIDLSTDDNLLLILYAGRMKNAKSFLNVYKLQEIIDYQGEENNGNEATKSDQVFSNTSGLMKQNPTVKIQKPVVIKEDNPSVLPIKTFACVASSTKYMQAKFAIFNKSILVSREDGCLELINFQNGKIITESKFHDDIILDFDFNSEKSLILTASRDGTACVINFDTFQVINKFCPQNPTRNLNACKIAVVKNPEYINSVNGESVIVSIVNDVNSLFEINPKKLDLLKVDIDDIFATGNDDKNLLITTKIKKEFIVAILSGGQDSKLVTTTNQKEGGFEIIIYDALEGNEMANYLTHFGPVNTLAVNKNILASGAEDATVRIYKLENYLFPIDKNK